MRRGATHTLLLACVITLGACASSPDSPIDASTDVIDAAAIDAEVEPDATPSNFGEACTTNLECATGYCVEGAGGGGGLCSRECADDCPEDWNCRTVTLPSGMVDLCIPEAAYHCSRCTSDLECPGGGCLVIDGEDRCASACATGTDCPGGYECVPDAVGGHAGMYCQPVTGSCTCDAGMAGATRTCSNTNGLGTCWGSETCNATEGWMGCNARVAEIEDCDGVDDDCDFVIDDDVGGGTGCDITNGNGTCQGVDTCMGATGFVCAGPTPAAELCNFVDDDCDSSSDEAFPTVGDLCSDGVGACLRYGAVRCDGPGTGVECSAVEGPTAPEACNGADDDCDTDTDETFAGLGNLCTEGLGECARIGTTVCNTATTGTECSATMGMASPTDVCNYVDEDCDGLVDEAYKTNPASSVYDRNTTCGSCEIDCTTLYAAPNAAGTCVVAGSPQCQMTCNLTYYNLNGSALDGCEFRLESNTIYVSTADPLALDDAGCGTGPASTGGGRHPCRTIAQGLARANLTGASNLRIADGTYDESVALVNGRNMYGGYRKDTWEQHLATTSTVIQGASTSGAHDTTVTASNITSPTVFQGFVVRGSFNAKVGGNSYAIYVNGSNSVLQLLDNAIFAGRGGPGSSGGVGGNGTIGVGGDAYVALTYDAHLATGTGFCNAASNDRAYANGGDRMCGGTDVGGGNGGGNRCAPVNTYAKFSGLDGFLGPGATGPNTTMAGSDGWLHNGSGGAGNSTCAVNTTSGWTQIGAEGGNGTPGGNAGGVGGCAAPTGSTASGHWVGSTGNNGLLGGNGIGGRGGGGGGGGYCTLGGCKDVLGGHGGGGGSGGCGGTGGNGGVAGGGVFGIFVVGGSAPTIAGNTIDRGDGGIGGTGGTAGAGGLGGIGGGGGQVPSGTAGGIFCSGKGGRGGDGGNGGAGSGGGGGCGGASYGIYTSGIGLGPTYCTQTGSAANTISGGSGGTGGSGGFSGGNSGGVGLAGILGLCSYN